MWETLTGTRRGSRRQMVCATAACARTSIANVCYDRLDYPWEAMCVRFRMSFGR